MAEGFLFRPGGDNYCHLLYAAWVRCIEIEPDTRLLREECSQVIASALERLSLEQRAVVRLSVFEAWEPGVLAQVLGWEKRRVEGELRSALSRLRRSLSPWSSAS